MNLQKELYNKLSDEKIKMNWNRNPIKMNLFLSFLEIDVERTKDHLGYCNGWTQLINKEHKLYIGGGIVKGVEYLDTIRFGNRLCSPYHNYVNPFYLFDILTTEGKKFFVDYYKEDIVEIVSSKVKDVEFLEDKLEKESGLLSELYCEVDRLHNL